MLYNLRYKNKIITGYQIDETGNIYYVDFNSFNCIESTFYINNGKSIHFVVIAGVTMNIADLVNSSVPHSEITYFDKANHQLRIDEFKFKDYYSDAKIIKMKYPDMISNNHSRNEFKYWNSVRSNLSRMS